MQRRPVQHVLHVPVDAAVAALGYLQAVAASLACVCAVIYVGLMPRFLEDYGLDHRRRVEYSMLTPLLMLGVVFGGYLITMAVLLIVGVKKRHAGYVLTYLVTGALACAALLAGCMIYQTNLVQTLAIFVALGVYSVWLHMVYCVYNNIKLEKNPKIMAYNTLHNPKEMEAQKSMKTVI